jgi:hypothetical protein
MRIGARHMPFEHRGAGGIGLQGDRTMGDEGLAVTHADQRGEGMRSNDLGGQPIPDEPGRAL